METRHLTTLLFTVFLAVSCNKLNPDIAKPGATFNEQPLPCKVGLIPDESGTPVPSKGVNLTSVMRAARPGKAEEQRYIIPVVFHVFGEPSSGPEIDRKFMENVLEWINNDFHGIANPEDPQNLNTIASEREEHVGTLDITFMLANFDPEGNPTEGIVKYPKTHYANRLGLGNATTEAFRAVTDISWDNYKYMNVYLTDDLYGDGVRNNSGVAWLPDAKMTDEGTARVVYNINYLPGGSYQDPDFTSVITHEFGHFMNLHHTFNENKQTFKHMLCNPNIEDGGNNGDLVDDTPQTQASSSYPEYNYHSARNCVGEITDYGNFMNYGVYCNFTKGQVIRMTDGLNDISRSNLWDMGNLIETIGENNLPEGGTAYPPTPPPTPPVTDKPSSNVDKVKTGETVIITQEDPRFPNISTESSTSVKIFNRSGVIIFSSKLYKGNYDMSALPKGTYYYSVKYSGRIYNGSVEII